MIKMCLPKRVQGGPPKPLIYTPRAKQIFRDMEKRKPHAEAEAVNTEDLLCTILYDKNNAAYTFITEYSSEKKLLARMGGDCSAIPSN